MGTILIVEDEGDIADLVKYHLEKAGLSARTVSDGRQALELIVREHPDLIILDLLLPGLEGLEVCRRLRGSSSTQDIPIIILTARVEEVDRIVGLELGADDYVIKPFSPRELVARVKAVLRRATATEQPSTTPVTMGRLRLDPVRHVVTKDEESLDLLDGVPIARALPEASGPRLHADATAGPCVGTGSFRGTPQCRCAHSPLA